MNLIVIAAAPPGTVRAFKQMYSGNLDGIAPGEIDKQVEVLWPPTFAHNHAQVHKSPDADTWVADETTNIELAAGSDSALLLLANPIDRPGLRMECEKKPPRRFERVDHKLPWLTEFSRVAPGRLNARLRGGAAVAEPATTEATIRNIKAGVTSDLPVAAVLNPLILRVPLEGNLFTDLDTDEKDDGTPLWALRDFLRRSFRARQLELWPELLPVQQVAVRVTEHLQRCRDDLGLADSLVVRLLLDGAVAPAWRRLFLLSGLPGRFELPVDESQWRWAADRELTGNQKFVLQYLDIACSSVGARKTRERSPPFARPRHDLALDLGFECGADEWSDVGRFLKAWAPNDASLSKALMALGEALQELADGRKASMHRPYITQRYPTHAQKALLLDTIGRELLTLGMNVELPDRSHDPELSDWISFRDPCVFSPGAILIYGLFLPVEERRQLEIRLTASWQSRWLKQRLFGEPTAGKIALQAVEEGGQLIVGQARVGDRLGRNASTVPPSPEFVWEPD